MSAIDWNAARNPGAFGFAIIAKPRPVARKGHLLMEAAAVKTERRPASSVRAVLPDSTEHSEATSSNDLWKEAYLCMTVTPRPAIARRNQRK
jgi:hypothetical protein